MSAQEYIERPQEDFLIIKADAVYNNKVMTFVYFDLWTLILFTKAILNSEIMQVEQG